FRLFAESAKKANPEQRGRFNLGEKLVLAICDEVTIRTTTASLRFDSKGRHTLRSTQVLGSRIECLIRMTSDECKSLEADAKKLISPETIATSFNGERLDPRPLVQKFNTTLRTEFADGDGFMRRADRETTVRLYE